VGIAVLIGVVVGAIGGFYGGVADAIVMRLVEIMMCIPTFFLILSLIAFMPRQSIYNIMIVIGVTGWTGVARLVRGEFLKLKAGDFVTAARATGLSDARIMFRHILPNALSPVLVSATFGVAGAILTESGLSFLGFGVPPPNPSWGEILKQSQNYVDFAWWLVMFPGLAVFITTTGFNLVGEGLRDAMDPRLRR
jgi:peptide/nickel transport system permease protein